MRGTSFAVRRPTLLAAILVVLAPLTIPAGAAPSRDGLVEPVFQGESGGPPDLDRRQSRREPTAAQEASVRQLGAAVRWNDFGTPQSLIRHGGYLATGLSEDPVAASRTWLRQHRGLFH